MSVNNTLTLDNWLDRYTSRSTRELYRASVVNAERYDSNYMTNFSDSAVSWQNIQAWINHMNKSLSSHTVHNYFLCVLKWLDANNLIDQRNIKQKVHLPRTTQRRMAGLSKDKIEYLLKHTYSVKKNKDDNWFNLYIRILLGGGLRETEALKLDTSMFEYIENRTITKVDMPSTITKFGIARTTFLPPNCTIQLKQHIKSSIDAVSYTHLTLPTTPYV